MKRFLSLLTSMLFVFLTCVTTVYAASDDTYFITYDGAELTKKQYDNLIKGFDEYTIYTMPTDTLNEFKNNETLYCMTNTEYYRYDVINDNGTLSEVETPISEQLYNLVSDIPVIQPRYSASCGTNVYETSYKKLQITVTGGASITYMTITLTNTWKKIPSCKSYDVLAIRPVQAALQFPSIVSESYYGTQSHDGTIIRYGESSDNFKICDSDGFAKSGVGLSQNIVNDVSTTLINSMTVKLQSGSTPYEVYGSYQHATSDVTLSESQNYEINVLGMGSVILFDEDVAENYDDMTGVYYSYPDMMVS